MTKENCELYLDHIPLWAGDGYYCSKCDKKFELVSEKPIDHSQDEISARMEAGEKPFDDWEKRFDEKFCSNTATDINNQEVVLVQPNDIKSFIASEKQASYDQGLKEKAPMGVSQWQEHGKKYGYFGYSKDFLDKVSKEAYEQGVRDVKLEKIEIPTYHQKHPTVNERIGYNHAIDDLEAVKEKLVNKGK